MAHSTIWMIVSIAGGALVTFGSWRYGVNVKLESKVEAEQESQRHRQLLAEKVFELLSPEVADNLALIDKNLMYASRGHVPMDKFRSTAWQTVSGSELILNLASDDLQHFLGIYHALAEVNELHGRIAELEQGVASALSGSAKTRGALLTQYVEKLGRFKGMLKKP